MLEQNYSVSERDYEMNFKHQDYRNILGRGKIMHHYRKLNIISELSFGEYLAGDKGYTMKFDRVFKNGTKFGVFFSRTDVPVELFGEGSFDKGITFTIPIRSLLSKRKP